MKSNALATVKDVFATFNTAFSFAPGTSAAVAAASSAADKFQNGLINAGTFKNHKTLEFYLKVQPEDNARVALTISALPGKTGIGSGNLVMYVRKIGSIALNTKNENITPLDILSNESLGARGCSPPDIVNGTCGAKSQAVRSTFSSIDKDAPPNLFDVGSPDGRKKIYNLCDKLRAHVTDSMRLATLDALLVRWAATRASLLQEKLANDKDLTQIANDTQRPAADIVDLCWNKVDNQTIKDIETAFGVKFDGPK